VDTCACYVCVDVHLVWCVGVGLLCLWNDDTEARFQWQRHELTHVQNTQGKGELFCVVYVTLCWTRHWLVLVLVTEHLADKLNVLCWVLALFEFEDIGIIIRFTYLFVRLSVHLDGWMDRRRFCYCLLTYFWKHFYRNLFSLYIYTFEEFCSRAPTQAA